MKLKGMCYILQLRECDSGNINLQHHTNRVDKKGDTKGLLRKRARKYFFHYRYNYLAIPFYLIDYIIRINKGKFLIEYKI